MPFISVTRLRIRSFRFLPDFGLHMRRSLAQLCDAAGFRGGGLLAGRHRAFWTMMSWDSEADMRSYMLSGDHRVAMPLPLAWCDEASIVHRTQEVEVRLDWAEADSRLRREGRPSKVRAPGPDHAGLRFPVPRLWLAKPIAQCR